MSCCNPNIFLIPAEQHDLNKSFNINLEWLCCLTRDNVLLEFGVFRLSFIAKREDLEETQSWVSRREDYRSVKSKSYQLHAYLSRVIIEQEDRIEEMSLY